MKDSIGRCTCRVCICLKIDLSHINVSSLYSPPVHGLRHPQIFYYGHTACLYVNKLRVAGVLDRPVNAYFESIFEVGVDEMLWDDMHKNDMVRTEIV